MQNQSLATESPTMSASYAAPDVQPLGEFTEQTLDSFIGSVPEFFAIVDVADVNIVWGE